MAEVEATEEPAAPVEEEKVGGKGKGGKKKEGKGGGKGGKGKKEEKEDEKEEVVQDVLVIDELWPKKEALGITKWSVISL